MSESLKDLKQIEAELQANKIKIAKAQQIEDEKQAEKKRKEDAERKEARQKAFVARQNLINLERDIAREVSLENLWEPGALPSSYQRKGRAF